MSQHYVPTDYKDADAWLKEGLGGDLIRNRSSLDWFIRANREELIRSGEVIVPIGKSGTKIGPRFGALVVEIMQRRQQERVA
jgi:hypothetical protein